jgi:hypothetical protein
MSQMIRYRNGDKGVSIKLGNPMTESCGLDIDRKQTLISQSGEWTVIWLW